MSSMKKRKRLSSLVMTVILSIFLLMPGSFANAVTTSPSLVFTALGDSIGAGYSAESGKGYVDLLYNYLKVQSRYSGLQLNNLSVPGITTSNLLQGLQGTDPQSLMLKASIQSSSIVTLSIGGNDLLQPVMAAVAVAFGVNPVNNPNLSTQLVLAIQNTPEAQRLQIFGQLLDPTSQLNAVLTPALAAAVQQFSVNFPLIIGQIKTLAPQAKIYIPTIYNPFAISDPCRAILDPLIQAINAQIKISAVNNNYQVYEAVDVYTAFTGHTGTPVVNFDFSLGALDPHPTNEGHKVIFQSHIKPVSSVTLNENSNTLKIGQTHQLSAVVAPQDAITNPDVIWTSSNSNIASVDSAGKVTAKAGGTAEITASTVDGNKTAVFTLNIPLTSIVVTKAPTKTSYVAGQSFDPAGMEVTAYYENQTPEVITDYTVTPATALAATDTKVSVSFGGKTVDQAITVVPVALTSIAITKAPTKTSYIEGQSFDPTGMEVTAYYNNGTSAKVTGYTVTPSRALAMTDNKVTVSYEGKTVNQAIIMAATVTFKDYNGDVIGTPQTVNYGYAATAPADPTRTGYVFAGWDKSFNNITGNLVVTATYTSTADTLPKTGSIFDLNATVGLALILLLAGAVLLRKKKSRN